MTELNYGDIAAGLSSIASGFKLLSSAFANAAAGVPAVACEKLAEDTQKLAEKVEAPAEKKEEVNKTDPAETFAKIREIFAVALKKDKKMAKAVLTRFGASITEVETNSPEKADALYDELVAAFGDGTNA